MQTKRSIIAVAKGEPFAVTADADGIERFTALDRLRPSRLNSADGGIHPLYLLRRNTAVLIERTAGTKVVLVKNKVDSLVGVSLQRVDNAPHILDKFGAVTLADEPLDT